MHTAVIIACYAVTVLSFNTPNITAEKINNTVHKNAALLNAIFEGVSLNNSYKLEENEKIKTTLSTYQVSTNSSMSVVNKTFRAPQHYLKNDIQNAAPILQRIHARITRSKDAVWATITLTSICILLVLAVAQSGMWKDNFYKENQGVPLPNFNERVLFKDVMKHRMSTLKEFFKKTKTKEKNLTELESLLPPSEWDS